MPIRDQDLLQVLDDSFGRSLGCFGSLPFAMEVEAVVVVFAIDVTIGASLGPTNSYLFHTFKN